MGDVVKLKANTPADVIEAVNKAADTMEAVLVAWITHDGKFGARWSCDIPDMAAMIACLDKSLKEEL